MSTEHVTSTGHDLADAGWLDQHFNFSREAYEAMVRWVGIQPGWHVLDAGCGSGSFLPLLADEVGPTGRLSALDLAPENIAAVEARFKAAPQACPVDMRQGSILALPYPDATFDAVWNSNVSQYLTDTELRQMVAEFKRVTKPGGLVAVKEAHGPGIDESLIPSLAYWRWNEAMIKSGEQEVTGWMRAHELAPLLRATGLNAVRRKFFGVDKYGPLNANDHGWRSAAIAWIASKASSCGLLEDDMLCWRQLADPQYVNEQLLDPDYYFRIEYVLAVGCVPG